MNYSVFWGPGTEEELAGIWLASTDRKAATQASHRPDQDLARDNYTRGFARNELMNRTAADRPLGIDCENVEDDKKARILRV